MKRLMFVVVGVVLLLLGCGEVKVDDKSVLERYVGLLPAADCPGIIYSLAIEKPKGGLEGTYKLDMTYIEAKDGKDLTFTSGGRLMVTKGSGDSGGDVVYRLIEDEYNDTTNFLFMGDSLVMLMRDLKRVDSGLSYTIRLVENKVVGDE